MAIRLSDDKELVIEIRKKLTENKDKYGEQFCPSVIPTKYVSSIVLIFNSYTSNIPRFGMIRA